MGILRQFRSKYRQQRPGRGRISRHGAHLCLVFNILGDPNKVLHHSTKFWKVYNKPTSFQTLTLCSLTGRNLFICSFIFFAHYCSTQCPLRARQTRQSGRVAFCGRSLGKQLHVTHNEMERKGLFSHFCSSSAGENVYHGCSTLYDSLDLILSRSSNDNFYSWVVGELRDAGRRAGKDGNSVRPSRNSESALVLSIALLH